MTSLIFVAHVCGRELQHACVIAEINKDFGARLTDRISYRVPTKYSILESSLGINRRQDIIERAHDSIFGGDFLSPKTLHKTNHLFCWPGMRKHVKSYVDSCIM